jgi:hypothetical protein
VKTNHNQSRRRTRMISNGVILALLLSSLPGMYAEDRRADDAVVESRMDKNTPRNQPVTESETSRHSIMVGPSAEEIHDFLYPTAKEGEVVTQAN